MRSKCHTTSQSCLSSARRWYKLPCRDVQVKSSQVKYYKWWENAWRVATLRASRSFRSVRWIPHIRRCGSIDLNFARWLPWSEPTLNLRILRSFGTPCRLQSTERTWTFNAWLRMARYGMTMTRKHHGLSISSKCDTSPLAFEHENRLRYSKDIHHAVTGRTFGHKLFRHPVLTYPFAIFTGTWWGVISRIISHLLSVRPNG